MDGVVSGLAVLVVIVGAAVGIALFFFQRHRRAVAELARALGGTRRGDVVTFVQDGREYRCECSRGRRYEGPWVELRTESGTGACWAVVPARGFGRLGDALGRGERLAIGDPELDRTLKLYSPTPLNVRTFFTVAERREALRVLFAFGADEVSQDEVELTVRWKGVRPDADLGARLVPAAAVALRRLAEGIPTVSARAAQRARILARRVAYGALIALALVTGWIAGVARDRFQVLDWDRVLVDSLWYSVPLAIGLAALVWRTGMANPRLRTGTFALIGGLVVMPYFALQVVIIANGWLDEGPATPHEARVLRLRPTGERGKEHEVDVVSWRDHPAERLSVRRDIFRHLQPGSRLRVVTKPGRLGYEWVAQHGLVDSDR